MSSVISRNSKEIFNFIFINEDGGYYTEALNVISPRNYIYQELKEAGYRCVFFVTGYTGDVRIEMLDEESANYFKSRLPFAKVEFSITRPYQTWASKMLTMLAKEKDCAFVFENLESFYLLLKNSDNEFNIKLKKNGRDWRSKNGSVIMLQSSLSAKAAYPYLAGDKSIFYNFEPDLLEPMKRILDPELAQTKHVDLFRAMKKNMDKEIFFLGDFTREQIGRVMRKHLLFFDQQNSYSERCLRDLTEICYFWYHSGRMQDDYPGLFEVNRSWNLQDLEKSLPLIWKKLKNTYNAMLAKVEETRKYDIPHFLLDEYPGVADPELVIMPIIVDLGIAQDLERLITKFTNSGRAEEDAGVRIRRMKYYSERFHIVYRQQFDPNVERLLNKSIAVALTALDKNDLDTVDHALDALKYCIERDFRYDTQRDDVWNNWYKIFDASIAIHEKDILISRITDKLREGKTLLNDYRDRIHELRDIQHKDPETCKPLGQLLMDFNMELDSYNQNMISKTSEENHRKALDTSVKSLIQELNASSAEAIAKAGGLARDAENAVERVRENADNMNNQIMAGIRDKIRERNGNDIQPEINWNNMLDRLDDEITDFE